MKKFVAWTTTQAGSLNIDVEPFFKKLNEAKLNVTTQQIFEEVNRLEPQQARNWIRLSGELQSTLVLLCEGEPLQIVEQIWQMWQMAEDFEVFDDSKEPMMLSTNIWHRSSLEVLWIGVQR